ncbi:UNVERIFIED_CONTAM: hypothetical protein PYX00_006485 [Menopon gallinae]|uniref:PDZ domain-containing protein n=1 Tax=Menopon gallinae TaxID=328185 RepID=A0AAW2HWL9_9NEOP
MAAALLWLPFPGVDYFGSHDTGNSNTVYMVGDQILEVNGQSFMDVTHDEAVNQLKIHKRMSLIVRDVGKVPHSCTAYDDYFWEPCPSTTLGDDRLLSGKSCCPTLQMIEEKARVLLNRNELTTLSYYQEEYASRQMTIEAFVTVLLELLNTPEKHNLLTELREVVLPEDRARFDELVYRRQPMDHDRHGHRRKDNSHSMLMSNIHDLPGPVSRTVLLKGIESSSKNPNL